LQEYRDAGLLFRIIRSCVHEHAGATHPLACCARAASGHVAAAPPSSVMNSRRFMCCLNPRIAAYHSVIGNSALCITASWAAQCLSWVKTGSALVEHKISALSASVCSPLPFYLEAQKLFFKPQSHQPSSQ
jgi:hypothetical protein